MAVLEEKFIDKLKGQVALVTGASRGVGKGIAKMLARAGAKVYITGRTLDLTSNKPGSLSATADEIRAKGGVCIPLQCDHADNADTKRVFDTIAKNEDGRLDILVNNATAAGELLMERGEEPFYKLPVEAWDIVTIVGVRSNYICSYYAAQLMIPRRKGLIVSISGMAGVLKVMTTMGGVSKEAVDRMSADMAMETKEHNVAVVSLWIGLVFTEYVRKLIADPENSDKFYNKPGVGEDPTFVGKAIVAMAADENIMKKTGKIQMSSELAHEYGYTDIGGNIPYSPRQLKGIVQFTWPSIMWLVPSFIYLPRWLFYLSGNKF